MTDAQVMKKLLETTQDIFIFRSVQAGLSGDTIKSVLRIDSDRVTRVSKRAPKKLRKKAEK